MPPSPCSPRPWPPSRPARSCRTRYSGRCLNSRSDRSLAGRLSSYSFAGRTFAWDIALEKKIASLSAAEVNAALKKYIDPARLAIVLAGDFKKE